MSASFSNPAVKDSKNAAIATSKLGHTVEVFGTPCVKGYTWVQIFGEYGWHKQSNIEPYDDSKIKKNLLDSLYLPQQEKYVIKENNMNSNLGEDKNKLYYVYPSYTLFFFDKEISKHEITFQRNKQFAVNNILGDYIVIKASVEGGSEDVTSEDKDFITEANSFFKENKKSIVENAQVFFNEYSKARFHWNRHHKDYAKELSLNLRNKTSQETYDFLIAERKKLMQKYKNINSGIFSYGLKDLMQGTLMKRIEFTILELKTELEKAQPQSILTTGPTVK